MEVNECSGVSDFSVVVSHEGDYFNQLCVIEREIIRTDQTAEVK